MDKQTLVIDALNKIIGNDSYNELEIAEYFSPDYSQTVNGDSLNYEMFVEHIKLLKQTAEHMHVQVVSTAVTDDTVFTHHFVDVLKADRRKSQFEVFARFTLKQQKIVSCHELTRMIKGESMDETLGSQCRAHQQINHDLK